MAKQVTIRVDYENNAETWWTEANLRSSREIPKSCRALFTVKGEPTVSAEDAAAFRAWGESLPGWADGPEYAREPFTFSDA